MNFEIFFRYVIEFLTIIPAAAFAVLPAREYIKIKSPRSILINIFLIFLLIFSSAYIAMIYSFRVGKILFADGIILFIFYSAVIDMRLAKKIFCFFNSVMICMMCNYYAILIMSPYEMKNLMWHSVRLFTIRSACVSLSLAAVCGIIFFRTFTLKLSTLLSEKNFESTWNYLFLIPLLMVLLLYWMTPINPLFLMTGRVRPIALVLITFLLFTEFMFYDILWSSTANVIKNAKLRQENNLYLIESKRYNELKNYMYESRVMRHDFRQHIAVLTELARAGKLDEILRYAEELNEKSRSYIFYCSNNAVDAIAAYYDSKAHTDKIKINWRLELPAELSVKESEFCAMLGNLIENALNAVKKIPVEERKINVFSSMLSESMIGISIDNPFTGEIKFNHAGLPVSKTENHGLGLVSVSNIVRRYNGSLKIKTEENIFYANIILYCPA